MSTQDLTSKPYWIPLLWPSLSFRTLAQSLWPDGLYTHTLLEVLAALTLSFPPVHPPSLRLSNPATIITSWQL